MYVCTRVFATLSGLPNPPVQFICAKGFYLLSITASRREELVQRRSTPYIYTYYTHYFLNNYYPTSDSPVSVQHGEVPIHQNQGAGRHHHLQSAGVLCH